MNRRTPLELSAEQRMQEPLNREMLVLVGSADRQQAIATARQLGEAWQASGLFEKVQWACKPTCRPCANNCCADVWRCWPKLIVRN